MVTISHVVVLTGALLTLLSLPCALAVIVTSDEAAIRRAWVRRSRSDRGALRILDRKLGQGSCVEQLGATVEQNGASEQWQPPIEQIAAELRRLDRQRRAGPTTESEAWSAAVARAYDEWLGAACRRLDVAEHLSTLEGVDRDIERVRIEGELQTAGLVLRSVADQPPR
jgi:hypothetical protein